MHDVVVGLGGRPVTRHVLRRLVEDVRAGRISDDALTFPDLDVDTVSKELARTAAGADGAALAGAVLGQLVTPWPDGGGRDMTELKLYQVGTFAAGNRLLDPGDRTEQSSGERSNSITSGHRACRGCGEALGARVVLDAAMHATGGRMVTVNATGCLEVFSTPYPESAWRVPWLHSLFGNAAAVASGVAATLRAQGRDDVRVVAQAGDGGTVDIGLGCLSGMFERNDDVLFVCYDNQGYMNTGVQRSGATPAAANTANTRPVGTRVGNAFGTGKSLPVIAMAHEIPYVATATVADLHDLEAKVATAMSMHGARYLHVLVPCPVGWGTTSADTIRVARLASRVRAVPGLRGPGRRGHRRTPDPPAGAGGGLPAEADPLRPPLPRRGPPRRGRPAAAPGRPLHRPLRAARGGAR